MTNRSNRDRFPILGTKVRITAEDYGRDWPVGTLARIIQADGDGCPRIEQESGRTIFISDAHLEQATTTEVPAEIRSYVERIMGEDADSSRAYYIRAMLTEVYGVSVGLETKVVFSKV